MKDTVHDSMFTLYKRAADELEKKLEYAVSNCSLGIAELKELERSIKQFREMADGSLGLLAFMSAFRPRGVSGDFAFSKSLAELIFPIIEEEREAIRAELARRTKAKAAIIKRKKHAKS